MAEILRLSEVHKDLLKEYYDLLVKRYGSDCPLLPCENELSGIFRSVLRDAISYNEWILNESEV